MEASSDPESEPPNRGCVKLSSLFSKQAYGNIRHMTKGNNRLPVLLCVFLLPRPKLYAIFRLIYT